MKRRTFLKALAGGAALAAAGPTTFVGMAKADLIERQPLIRHGRYIVVTQRGVPHWFDTQQKVFLPAHARVEGQLASHFIPVRHRKAPLWHARSREGGRW